MTGVSRVSVRTALKSLIAQGFLVSRQGDGTFVVDVSVDMNMDILVPIIGLDKRNILEVLEYRKILEVGIVPLIFENLTEDDSQVSRTQPGGARADPGRLKRLPSLIWRFTGSSA